MTIRCIPYQTLTRDQLYDIMRLRQEVFVVEQKCAYLDADDKDQYAHHLMLYSDHRLLAYARLLPKGVSYTEYVSIGRVVSDQSERKSGLGKKIMQKAIEEAQRKWPDTPIKISAQTYIQAFYHQMGFRAVGAVYLEDGIPHVAMVLEQYIH